MTEHRHAQTHQWLVASLVMKFEWMTESVRARAEKGSKEREKGWPVIQPTMTARGMAKRAIWMLEPTATPSARSILFLVAPWRRTGWALVDSCGSMELQGQAAGCIVCVGRRHRTHPTTRRLL